MNKTSTKKFSGLGVKRPASKTKAYPSASMGGTQEFRKPKAKDKENRVKGFRKSPENRIENKPVL
jgi:hypothetical protein